MEASNADKARKLTIFSKTSPKVLNELRTFILNNFGFGDFIFRYPDGKEITGI